LTRALISIVSRMLEQATDRSANDGDCEVFTFDAERVRRAHEAAWPPEELEAVADLLKLTGSPARLRVLLSLTLGELCVCDLAQVLGLSVSATSSQLQMLRRAGLISYRKSGKLAFYSLRRPELLELITGARELAATGKRG